MVQCMVDMESDGLEARGEAEVEEGTGLAELRAGTVEVDLDYTVSQTGLAVLFLAVCSQGPLEELNALQATSVKACLCLARTEFVVCLS